MRTRRDFPVLISDHMHQALDVVSLVLGDHQPFLMDVHNFGDGASSQ